MIFSNKMRFTILLKSGFPVVVAGLFLSSSRIQSLHAQINPAGRPYWWENSGAVTTQDAAGVGIPANDSAVAAVGQAMHMAAKARETMAAVYGARFAAGQYGLGVDIHKVITDFDLGLERDTSRTLQNRALKQGQLKYMAAPFWKRLQELGVAGVPEFPARPYPWPAASGNDNTLVTLGQVKKVFSFPIGPSVANTTSAVPAYQNRIYNDLPEVTGKADSAYLFEEFDRPEATKSLGTAAASAAWRNWRPNGTAAGQGTVLRRSVQALTTKYPDSTLKPDGSPASLTGGYLRLPPVFDSRQPLAFLSLTVTIPGGSNPAHDNKYLYIQYRWRAFPDTTRGGFNNTPLTASQQMPGALVFCERNLENTQWVPYRALGWERFPALIVHANARKNYYVGACDMAFPVISPYSEDTNFDVHADGAFSLLCREGASQNFPPVAGPGWRTTTIRVDLTAGRNSLPDAMDIWLDGIALGRSYGQSNLRKEPAYRSTRFSSLVPFDGTITDFQKLHLKWNGLRNADFDLGAIYVGRLNPLFIDPDHDGIPRTATPQSNTSILHVSKPWMPWWEMIAGSGGISHFEEIDNSPLNVDGGSDRDSHDARDHRNDTEGNITYWQEWLSSNRPRPFHKLDIARFLLNLQHPESTLPPAYRASSGNPQIAPRSNAGAWEFFSSWEEMIDADMDDQPDFWERRYFGNITSNGPQDDPDHDGIPNSKELEFRLHPLETPANDDVDGDGLKNTWELQNGFDAWAGGGQGADDPDRDGRSNTLEQQEGTDPLIANGDFRTGPPVEMGFPDSSHPPAPATEGDDLKKWMPGMDESNPDIDGDGVSNDLDAVPYDENLAFARAPESQYIVMPLMGAGNIPENGQPLVINNAGHILLAPQAPAGGWWSAYPGIGTGGTETSRAPRLWKKTGQNSVPVPLPPVPEAWSGAYTVDWNHGEAASLLSDHNERLNHVTLEMDLAPDSDLVLAHAQWAWRKSTPPAKSPHYPDTVKSRMRIPDLMGRHAFVWDGGLEGPAKWLPWSPPDKIGGTSIEHFLTMDGQSYGNSAGTGTGSVAGRLLSGGIISGLRLTYNEYLETGDLDRGSVENFNLFSWTDCFPGMGSAAKPKLSFAGAVEGSRMQWSQSQAEGEPQLLFLHGSPTRRIAALSWRHHAIIEDESGGQPRRSEPLGSFDPNDIPTPRRDAAKTRRPVNAIGAGSSFYYLADPWTTRPEPWDRDKEEADPATCPLLLSRRPWTVASTLNDFPMDRFTVSSEPGTLYPPFTRGPLIIGPPGRYWTRSAQAAVNGDFSGTVFVGDWLYSHPGIEDTEKGFSAEDKIPFELSNMAKINNQGVIICEDRIWRNGRGHNIKDLIPAEPGTPTDFSEFRLHSINDSGTIAATAISKSRKDRIPVVLLPVEVVELSPKLRDADNNEIAGSEVPKNFPESNSMVEETPNTNRIAHREMKVKVGSALKDRKITWTMDAKFTPEGQSQPSFRGDWARAAAAHRDRFETSTAYGAHSYRRISQESAETTVDAEGFTAIRVNVPPIGFNKARIKIQIEGTTIPIELIDLDVQAVVVIDPGHGGTPATDFESATWNNSTSPSGVLEKAMALSYGQELKTSLETHAQAQHLNIKVLISRTADVSISGRDRAYLARDNGADQLFIIHFNAFTDDDGKAPDRSHTARGSLEVRQNPNLAGSLPEDIEFIDAVLDRMVPAMQPYDTACNRRAHVFKDTTVATDLYMGNEANYHPVRAGYCEVEFIDFGAQTPDDRTDDAVDILLNTGPNAGAVKTAIANAMRDGIILDLRTQPRPTP